MASLLSPGQLPWIVPKFGDWTGCRGSRLEGIKLPGFIQWLQVTAFTLLALLPIEAVRAQSQDIRSIVASCDDRIERYRKGNVRLLVQDEKGRALRGGSILVELKQHEFLFGCNLFALGNNGDEEANFRDRFAEAFNFATLGFYWPSYEPQQGQRLRDDRMQAARWCQSHGIQAKGHPLVWNLEPAWLVGLGRVRSEQVFWARVSDEVSHFAGAIDTWDVVNESTEGVRYAKQRRAHTLLDMYQKYGVSPTVVTAMTLARRANPDATLVLNDYDTSAAYEQRIQSVLELGGDIDAIGIQSHMHQGYWGAKKIWETCNRFGKYNKPLHFTELTVLSGQSMAKDDHDWETRRTDWNSSEAGEQRQAMEVREAYHLLFSHPAVEAITWWDFCDRHAWLGAPGGLLRQDYSPKPAYYVIRDLVRKGWTTRLESALSDDGAVDFRGFFGTYRVRLEQSGGAVYLGSLSFPKASADGNRSVEMVVKLKRLP